MFSLQIKCLHENSKIYKWINNMDPIMTLKNEPPFIYYNIGYINNIMKVNYVCVTLQMVSHVSAAALWGYVSTPFLHLVTNLSETFL